MQMKHTRNITLAQTFKRIYQSTKNLPHRKRMFGFAASLLLAAAFFSGAVLSSAGAQAGLSSRLTTLSNRATRTASGWFGAPLSGTISGQVFRDFNADGTDDGADEPGVGGVTVTAYDSAGVNQGTATTYAFNCVAAGNPDASCTGLGTPALGSYSLSAGGTGPYRIEFTNLPTDAYSGPVGNGSATSVQFVADGNSSNVNFGINKPIDYSQANPKLVTPCYTNGDAAHATVTNTDALVSLNYDGTGTVGHLVPTGQIGATWGLAWNRYNRQLFVSAVIRRHSGFGPQGIGGLYAFNISAGGTTATAAWSLDLNTLAGINVGSVASRDLTTLTAPSADADAFSKIGKAGIGDIDLEEDGKTLWLVNMKDGAQSLIKINVANASPAPTGATNYPLSGIAGVPTCTNGVFRPWGLKFRNRQGYLAGVCSAELVGGVRANMTAGVLRFDPANPAAGFTTVLVPIQLDYSRLQAYPGLFGSFRPWTDTMTPILAAGVLPTPPTGASSRQFSYPTPVFCDIEFDNDGSMILGFLDRSGLQFGANNWDPRGAGVQMVYHTTAGELLRAFNNNGTFQIENNGQVGPLTSSGTLLNSGPGGKEFYWGEEFPHPGEEHRETGFGGLALVPGKPDIALTLMDPFDLDSGGLGWLSNTDGSSVRKSQIYQGGNDSNGTYGKSIGLGDLEALSDQAPIEIGNRLWMDTNSNGRQDSGEMGLSGVTVKLFNAANAEIGSVATDANGNYLFSNASGTDAAGRDYNVNGLTANTNNFQIRILLAQGGSLSGKALTIADADADANGDSRDSDAASVANPAGSPAGVYGVITFSTGDAGANNHTYDAGFVKALYSIGNRVWYDTDNSGTFNGAEVGINGVKVRLLRSPALTQATDINGALVADQTTAAGGYYRFDNLPAGDYVVEVAAMNFNSGMPLHQYLSSTGDEADPNADIDGNDNGIGSTPDATSGIRSGVVMLGTGLNSEPTNDNDPTTNPLVGEEPNDQSNRTVDFGFFKLCLGNLVWNDVNNNGAVDAGEQGLGNVMMELLNAAGNVVQTTTTATGGVYSFCGLLPGDYRVRAMLPAGYVSSTGLTGTYEPAPDPDNDSDNDDNGSNVAGQPAKVVSLPISLTPGSEQTVDNLTASTANNTLDFGVFQPSDLVFNGGPGGAGTGISHPMNPLMTGMDADYIVKLTNAGPGVTVGTITITITLPNGLVYKSGGGNGWTCSPTGQTLSCANPGPMAVGAMSSFTFTVGVLNAATPNVTVTGVAGVVTDVNLSNNTANDPGPVTNGLGAPGAAFPEISPMSDQKAGSLLIYPVYSSDAANPSRENTRISLTNLDVAKSVCAHMFFVDGASCSVADSYICLTPQQTTGFLMSDLDPGTTGYVVAVAVDDNGCPISFNKLIGDEYVKFGSGHQANLAAESYAALYSGVLPGCNDQATTATLNLDGVQYNLTGKALAASNIGSMADGNNSMLVLTRTGGNLGLGAGTLGNLFGIFYDDTESSLSFTVASSACQLRRTLSNDFPRTAPRLSQFIPAGRTGWFKVWMTGNGGMIGAILNANSNAASTGGAFSGGHNLHALTLTNDSFLIPVFPPSR